MTSIPPVAAATTAADDAPRIALDDATPDQLLDRLVAALSATTSPDGTEATEDVALDAIATAERAINRLRGAQALQTTALKERRLAADKARGVPAGDRGKGLGRELAGVRGIKPSQGNKLLELADVLTSDLPNTFETLHEQGTISENAAGAVVQEVKELDPDERRSIDTTLRPHLNPTPDPNKPTPPRKPAITPTALGELTRREVQEHDPGIAEEKARKAEQRRNVRIGSAPDGMAWLTAYLPARDAHLIGQALEKQARAIVNSGITHRADDPTETPRTIEQIKADLLTEWMRQATAGQTNPLTDVLADTGNPLPPPPPPPPPPVKLEVVLVMNQDTFFDLDDAPVWFPGFGTLTANQARRWICDDPTAEVYLRRLFTRPGPGELVRMESRARSFPRHLRKLLMLRDDRCRSPFCDNPVTVADHITRHADGGPTSFANGLGLCRACNQAKETTGWTYESTGSSVIVTTPSGQVYETVHKPMVRGLENLATLPPDDPDPPPDDPPPNDPDPDDLYDPDEPEDEIDEAYPPWWRPTDQPPDPPF